MMGASQHRIARPAPQGGSALSMARAPQRVCVKKDGFAQRALCQLSIQVGNLWLVLYLQESQCLKSDRSYAFKSSLEMTSSLD